MRRYGKKLDRNFNRKHSRSNRGRARTSATSWERDHANFGYRRGPQQLAEQRAFKRRTRFVVRLDIQDELYDMFLAANDEELWSFGTNLTTHKDFCTKRHAGYPDEFSSYFYTRRPDPHEWEWDDGLDDERLRDDEDDYYRHRDEQYDHGRGRSWTYDDATWDAGEPEPTDPLWVDLWVAGRAHDPEGRDQANGWHEGEGHGYDHDWGHDWDYFDDLVNPLLARGESAVPAVTEAVEERDLERHRAGERYFRQYKRTVMKPIGRAA